jgi:hypothetical protein
VQRGGADDVIPGKSSPLPVLTQQGACRVKGGRSRPPPTARLPRRRER